MIEKVLIIALLIALMYFFVLFIIQKTSHIRFEEAEKMVNGAIQNCFEFLKGFYKILKKALDEFRSWGENFPVPVPVYTAAGDEILNQLINSRLGKFGVNDLTMQTKKVGEYNKIPFWECPIYGLAEEDFEVVKELTYDLMSERFCFLGCSGDIFVQILQEKPQKVNLRVFYGTTEEQTSAIQKLRYAREQFFMQKAAQEAALLTDPALENAIFEEKNGN